jgi:Ca2+-binding RTX toxin-like protein
LGNTGGADVIGDAGDATLSCEGRNDDTAQARSGDNTLTPGLGAENAYPETVQDTIFAGVGSHFAQGNNIVLGEDGNDFLRVTPCGGVRRIYVCLSSLQPGRETCLAPSDALPYFCQNSSLTCRHCFVFMANSSVMCNVAVCGQTR